MRRPVPAVSLLFALPAHQFRLVRAARAQDGALSKFARSPNWSVSTSPQRPKLSAQFPLGAESPGERSRPDYSARTRACVSEFRCVRACCFRGGRGRTLRRQGECDRRTGGCFRWCGRNGKRVGRGVLAQALKAVVDQSRRDEVPGPATRTCAPVCGRAHAHSCA
eukprot:5019335-Pleurochrysis_carterae.AAC.2